MKHCWIKYGSIGPSYGCWIKYGRIGPSYGCFTEKSRFRIVSPEPTNMDQYIFQRMGIFELRAEIVTIWQLSNKNVLAILCVQFLVIHTPRLPALSQISNGAAHRTGRRSTHHTENGTKISKVRCRYRTYLNSTVPIVRYDLVYSC